MVIDVVNSSRENIIRWIKEILLKHRIRLKKSLSQVMMVEPKAFKKIVEAVSSLVMNSEKLLVVEIGTGLGTLTSALGKNLNNYIISIELDQRFVLILKELQEFFYNLDVVIGDAKTLLSSIRNLHIVVGNLPYHITSDLVLEIGRSSAKYAVITVQKDVADRFVAKPGSKNYSKISLLTQYLFDVEILKVIPPNYFIPPPDVFSAIVVMKRKRAYSDYADVEAVIKCMFSFRRKQVLKSLKRCLNLEIKTLDIDESGDLWKKRVYQLAPEDIEKLATVLRKIILRRE
ncbi:MAG: 16S rRNA (adenine(1518)-N(6)/adenine(1519)-N(6))-dimethyltransferase RsmA [Desulfurococcaceae archaeon]|jgi:16S rRNA (adenine1518-N6/adenine1519-N6)-dimethyltransferase|nr:16S rRNA (adenine(1518)-N(6)/adenine(1519)-N(6))-dimethyltransferase RsmA [Desulfurococcaceae archaeon]